MARSPELSGTLEHGYLPDRQGACSLQKPPEFVIAGPSLFLLIVSYTVLIPGARFSKGLSESVKLRIQGCPQGCGSGSLTPV